MSNMTKNLKNPVAVNVLITFRTQMEIILVDLPRSGLDERHRVLKPAATQFVCKRSRYGPFENLINGGDRGCRPPRNI